MRARTHVWIADQAVHLLATDERTAALADLLRDHVKEMWLGASWLPDVCFGDVNVAHVCRSIPVTDDDLLPRRIRELFDSAVAHVPTKDVPFTASQTALGFFILSHYVADANTPLHVDPRLSEGTVAGRIAPALHHQVEGAWEGWFTDSESSLPVLIPNGDSPLSIVTSSAAARFTDSPAVFDIRPAIRDSIERSRELSATHIPDGCRNLPELTQALGPLGLEMLAADVLAMAIADVATFWRAAWLKAMKKSALTQAHSR